MAKKILLVVCLLSVYMTTLGVTRYGYAPEVCVEEDMIAQGSGTNGFCAGMICLDPNSDPVVKRLEGHFVKGVRCYFLNDYKQSRQNRSKVLYATGNINSGVNGEVCDFVAGWNEIYFNEPLQIGNEPIYVGVQVYELRGTPYPLVTFGNADVKGGCWINLEDEGWVEYNNRGILMIQAILDDESASEIEDTMYASVEKSPLVIAPAEDFNAGVYVHNMTNKEVSNITLSVIGQGDTEAHNQDVEFSVPLAAREGRMIELPIRAGSEEGLQQWLRIKVVEINGNNSKEAMVGESIHNVTVDAFNRIPLIEEFTSQACSNCPFMIYYLDMAMEKYDGPLAYVTHHSGFVDDRFTKPMDKELLYLFGTKTLMNPAVMYDRWVPEGESSPIFGAQLAEYEPYLEQIQAAAIRPAMASVEIDLNYNENEKTVGCTVSGRIGSSLVTAGVPTYLSVYLVEDQIPVTEENFQLGLDGEDAPSDLKEKFRHNGVKRHVFNTVGTGDEIAIDEEGNYSVTFDPIALDNTWNINNLKVLAYATKVNKDDIAENGVLNANYEHLIKASVISIDTDPVKADFRVTRQGKIEPVNEIADYSIYNLQGVKIGNNEFLQQGIYIVNFITIDGKAGAKKLIVK